jgi:lysophospholipase L1-like esterase
MLLLLAIVSLSGCGGTDSEKKKVTGPIVSSSSDSDPLESSSSSIITDPLTYDWHSIAANDPAIRITGRADLAIPTQPLLEWAGSSIEFSFEGTSAKAILNGKPNYLNVFIDNDTVPASVIDLENSFDTLYTLAENLTPGVHTIKIYKRTEAQVGSLTFKGLQILGAPGLKPLPARPERRIEFIGNSITCGYGNLDTRKENGFANNTEDHYFTYGAMLARHFNAESHAICFSGRGVYRNNNNGTNGILPQLFQRQLPYYNTEWDFANWTPQVVSVNLGTNDFYKGIPDSVGFVTAVVDFVKDIKSEYPSAKVLILDGPMLSDYFPPVLPADVDQFPVDASGYASAYYTQTGATFTYKSQTVCQRFLDAALDVLVADLVEGVQRHSLPSQTPTLGYGADWHPNVARNYAMAAELVSVIEGLDPEW